MVAAAVGGLRTVVQDGVTGRLVASHDPAEWADALDTIAYEIVCSVSARVERRTVEPRPLD